MSSRPPAGHHRGQRIPQGRRARCRASRWTSSSRSTATAPRTAGRATGGWRGPSTSPISNRRAREDHTVLLGATTYRLMSGFAAAMPDDPGLAGLTAMPKVVFSSTLEEPLSWSNAELAGGDPVETVRELKRRDARPLRTVGSLTLCRSLVAAPAWSTGSASSSSRSSPAPPGRTASSTATPTSPSTWSSTAPFDGRLQLLGARRPRCWTRTARRRRPGLSPRAGDPLRARLRARAQGLLP